MMLNTLIQTNTYTANLDASIHQPKAHRTHLIQPPLPPTPEYYTEDNYQNSYPNNVSVSYSDLNEAKAITKSALYKTELCKRFSEFGICRYGAKCQFAHGQAELRHVLRHPKYKTTRCKSYWGSGHCPYGSRCRFIHEDNDIYAIPALYSNHSSSFFSTISTECTLKMVDKKDASLGNLQMCDNAIWASDSLVSLAGYACRPTCDSLSDSSLTAASSDEEDPCYPDLEDAINAFIQCSVSDVVEEDVSVQNADWNFAFELTQDLKSLNSTVSDTPDKHSDSTKGSGKGDSGPRLRIFERFH